jgi:hypothetical protein
MQLHTYRQTQAKLGNVTARLSDLFPDVDPAVIHDEVRAISRTLIADARFCDYVPVLTYRFASDRLREGRLALPEAA